MGKAEATLEELVGRIERGQLRLPEMQRRYVWRSPRLLDGQQRLTSLSAVIRGEPVNVRGRKKPLELLFNLEHPEQLTMVTEVNEQANDDEPLQGEDDADCSEDELQKRKTTNVSRGEAEANQ